MGRAPSCWTHPRQPGAAARRQGPPGRCRSRSTTRPRRSRPRQRPATRGRRRSACSPLHRRRSRRGRCRGCPPGTGGWLFLSIDRRDALEHTAGYTSGASCHGLWRLARDVRVLRRPDLAVPPSGWYPSPYFPGVLQAREGPSWKPLPQRWWRHEKRYFRAPAVTFL